MLPEWLFETVGDFSNLALNQLFRIVQGEIGELVPGWVVASQLVVDPVEDKPTGKQKLIIHNIGNFFNF